MYKPPWVTGTAIRVYPAAPSESKSDLSRARLVCLSARCKAKAFDTDWILESTSWTFFGVEVM